MSTTDPVLSLITAPIDPVQVDDPILLSATYEEVNTVTATWYFDSNGDLDETSYFEFSFPGDVSEDGKVSASFSSDIFVTSDNPKGAGVYSVKLVVVDDCGNTSYIIHDEYLVVYDPEGGFVTGGGWIYSEPESMPYNLTAEGKANFGFNAKYQNGKNPLNEVDGNTNFQFKEGDFHFKSSSHDKMSLVISGAKATYRGVGTVNGSGNHKFMVTATDGDLIGKSDKFRIRVWAHNSSSDVIYDNELEASENAEATTELGGGSIVIHKPKGGANKEREAQTVASAEVEVPDILETLTAYPNPVERSAQISFSLKASAKATLKVYDFGGREVQQLFQGEVEAERVYEVQFDRYNLMPGVYIYRLTTEQGQVYHKQLIIK